MDGIMAYLCMAVKFIGKSKHPQNPLLKQAVSCNAALACMEIITVHDA